MNKKMTLLDAMAILEGMESAAREHDQVEQEAAIRLVRRRLSELERVAHQAAVGLLHYSALEGMHEYDSSIAEIGLIALENAGIHPR